MIIKLQTLELWCQQQQNIGNLPPSAGDRYQIMRQDHQLGIDAFVAEAMRLSPNVTTTQALKFLQNHVSKSYLKQVATVALWVDPAGFYSLLLRFILNVHRLTPLTFCLCTGKINSTLLTDVLSTALNLGPVTCSSHA